MRPTLMFPAAERRGGVERVVLESLDFLGRRYETTFIGHVLEGLSDATPIRHITPPEPVWGIGALAPVAFRTSARRCIQREQGTLTVSHGVNAPPGDVYHVHSAHRAWLRAARAIRVRGIRIPRATRYLLPRHQTLLALEWDYFRRHHPRRIIAVSEALAEDLVELYAVPRETVTVIPNGFDPSECNPQRRRALRNSERELARLHPDSFVVLFVANELHRKGFAVLLEAVGRMNDEHVEIHVFGRMALDDYQQVIEARGLRNRVHYHGATKDVGRAHALADILVLPTQYETFGMAILEALASGLPVIIPRGTPGAGERVRHDENGLLMESAVDAEELEALLSRALDDRRRAGWSSQTHLAVADLAWSTVMERVEAALREVA